MDKIWASAFVSPLLLGLFSFLLVFLYFVTLILPKVNPTNSGQPCRIMWLPGERLSQLANFAQQLGQARMLQKNLSCLLVKWLGLPIDQTLRKLEDTQLVREEQLPAAERQEVGVERTSPGQQKLSSLGVHSVPLSASCFFSWVR